MKTNLKNIYLTSNETLHRCYSLVSLLSDIVWVAIPMFLYWFEVKDLAVSLVCGVGFLAMGEDWRMYCMALETYLHQVAAHTTLSKNKCLENFLTSSEVCYYHQTLFSFSSCLILPLSQCPILSCSV